MATCTHRISTASTTNNAATYASGLFTPAAGEVIVVMVTVSGHTNANPVLSSSITGQVYPLISTQLFAASANRIYMFVGNFFATAVSQRVTFNASPATITGCIIQAVGVSGLQRTGLDAVRTIDAVMQVGGQANQAAAGTPTPVLPANALTVNPTITFVGNSTNPATLTPNASWTERNDTGFNTPATGAEYATRDSGFTSTSVAYGGTSASVFASMVLELDTSDLPVAAKSHRFDLQAATRAAYY